MEDSLKKYYEKIFIPETKYIYRVIHRTMEGDCQYDHGPREMTVGPICIDKYPVTNRLFKVFINETAYKPADNHNFLRNWIDGTYPEGLEDYPVVWVSQQDAKAYAKWAGGRLPYDYEWQYAASGKEKLTFPWGSKFIKENCNYKGNELTPVDKYADGQSSFGLMDMCGNAREWVQDEIDDGMHKFTFLRGGCHFKAQHFWHTDGGARPNNHHLKFQLLNEGLNRCGTTTFRCVKECK